MTESNVRNAVEKAHVLDQETQAVLHSVKRNNTKALISFLICWSILFVVGIIGIYRQNEIAQQNKQHIDCIIKLFVTPLPKDAQHKVITDPSASCGISFSK